MCTGHDGGVISATLARGYKHFSDAGNTDNMTMTVQGEESQGFCSHQVPASWPVPLKSLPTVTLLTFSPEPESILTRLSQV